jgi:Straboviridae/Kyanoviridae head completion nuclease
VDANTRAAMNALPSRGQRGLFRPLHPEKYAGDARQIVYRSRLELALMRRLDSSPSVIAWASEPLVVPWEDARGRQRRYIPDFLVRTRSKTGLTETLLIEVKPRSQSPRHAKLATTSKKSRRTLVAEAMTIDANRRKWESAERFAAAHGMKFKVMTETELGHH